MQKKLKKPNILSAKSVYEKMEINEPNESMEMNPFDMLGDLVSLLLTASARIHIAHLLTESYSAHKAMNEFYDEVIDLADDVAEQAQGAFEKLLNYKTQVVSPIKTTAEALEFLNMLYAKINEIQEHCYHSEINNTLDEIKSLINSTKYKLLFLK